MFLGLSWSDGVTNIFDPMRSLSGVSGKVGTDKEMARQSRAKRRRPHLWTVVAMASTASAVSLDDLQPLSSGILPATCSIAYNATLLGCTTADFASGSHCSEACEIGVEIIERVIDSVCDDVDASRNSVLGFAQRGSLLRHVCRGNDVTLPQTTSTTAASYTTTIPIVLTTSTPTSSSLTQFTVTATTSLTIPFSTLSTTSLQTTSQAETQSSSTPSSTKTSTTVSTSTKTSTTASTTSSQGDGRGGGSPFDAQASLSSRHFASWPLCFSVAAVLLGTFIR